MKPLALRLLDDIRGATAVEYGLIAAALSLVVATAVGFLGEELYALWDRILAALGGQP